MPPVVSVMDDGDIALADALLSVMGEDRGGNLLMDLALESKYFSVSEEPDARSEKLGVYFRKVGDLDEISFVKAIPDQRP